MEIKYIKGDATNPNGDDNKIIVHVCNDIGAWGKGFVMALSNRWPQPEAEYRAWFKSKIKFGLGHVQFVQVTENIWVANMIGQHTIHKDAAGNPPIRYEAVREGLVAVFELAKIIYASVHMPRIGCGLAGGTWDKIEPIIEQTLAANGIQTTVYDL